MKTVLITGANRGIGLALSRIYAGRSDTRVFAACRTPDQAIELRHLRDAAGSNVEIVRLDVGDQSSIDRCVRNLSPQSSSLDLLINNAGIFGGTVPEPLPETSRFGSLVIEKMNEIFRINTIAPVIVSQACVEVLSRSPNPRIVNVSSDAGSITLREHGGGYSYPASKAALNMMTRCMSAELLDAGIVVVSVHPGFLSTDMGGPNAPRSPEETMPSLVSLIDELSARHSGRFWNWDGSEIPW